MVQITGVSATGSIGEVGVRTAVFDFHALRDDYSRRRTVYLAANSGTPRQKVSSGGQDLKNPQFTYSEGSSGSSLLTLITYEGGHTKTFTYNSDDLPTKIETTIDGTTTTKTLNYNDDKSLDFITES